MPSIFNLASGMVDEPYGIGQFFLKSVMYFVTSSDTWRPRLHIFWYIHVVISVTHRLVNVGALVKHLLVHGDLGYTSSGI